MWLEIGHQPSLLISVMANSILHLQAGAPLVPPILKCKDRRSRREGEGCPITYQA
jgi:hypothetical protein